MSPRISPASPTGKLRPRGKRLLPDQLPLRRLGEGETQDRVEAPDKSLVDIILHVGGQNDQPVEILDPLQQIGDLLVGVLVVGVADAGALSEKRVGLVEKEYPAFVLGAGKQELEVLLRLADIFRDDHRKVDLINVLLHLVAEQRRRQRFTRPGGTVEQRTVALLQPVAHAPVFQEMVVVL